MKTFKNIVGYVQNIKNGCAFVRSAAVGEDSIFVQPSLAKGLEVGSTVTMDVAEGWDSKKEKDGLTAIHIYSVEPPVSSTAFATVHTFNPEKMVGSAVIAHGDFVGKPVHLPASVIEAAGFNEKLMPSKGQPCRIVFMVMNNGNGFKLVVKTMQTGSEVSSTMKRVLAEKPELTVVEGGDNSAPAEDDIAA